MPDYEAAIETLTSTETLMMLGGAGVGFMAPTVVNNLLAGRVPIVPEEAAGIAITGLLAMFQNVPAGRAMQAGALAHTANQAAARAGVRQQITSIGGGN